MSDWIKLRSDLDTDPRIFAMGELLRLSAQSYILTQRGRDLFGDVTDTVTRDVLRDVTLAALTRVWFAANRHTTDGVFKNATLDYLDTLAQVPGFGQAMATVGYAVYTPSPNSDLPSAGVVTLPRFAEYNSPNKNGLRSKTKAAERTARYRENKRLKDQGEGLSTPLPPSDSSAPADPKEKESDASRDVTRDVTSSYSSSLSKSTESTPSDSDQSNVVPPSGGSGQRPTPEGSTLLPPRSGQIPDSVRQLDTAKQRINALLPKSWGKLTRWNCEEESALHAALPNLQALDSQDWLVLGWFMNWVTKAANTSQRNPVQVTSKRHQFVTEIASILNRATTAWKQNGSPKLTTDATKPSPKPKTAPAPPPADRATAGSFAASLQAHGGQLPPARPTTAADHLLHDLGIAPITLPPPDFNSPAYQALVESTAA